MSWAWRTQQVKMYKVHAIKGEWLEMKQQQKMRIVFDLFVDEVEALDDHCRRMRTNRTEFMRLVIATIKTTTTQQE